MPGSGNQGDVEQGIALVSKGCSTDRILTGKGMAEKQDVATLVEVESANLHLSFFRGLLLFRGGFSDHPDVMRSMSSMLV